jgi:hypothetical protein
MNLLSSFVAKCQLPFLLYGSMEKGLFDTLIQEQYLCLIICTFLNTKKLYYCFHFYKLKISTDDIIVLCRITLKGKAVI